MDDARTQRDRIDGLNDSIDNALGDQATCSTVQVCVTFTKVTYPVVPGAFYAIHSQSFDGAEVEGGTMSFSTVGDEMEAYNLGTAIPPVTVTQLLVFQVGDRYFFRYDG